MTRRAVVALTPPGAKLGRTLASQLGADLWLPHNLALAEEIGFTDFSPAVARVWTTYRELIFIAATGIVVRSTAPLLQGKDRDPAVVVLDHSGRYAVSLLSGHLGGANHLAREVAALTQGQAVITTATDSLGFVAIDDVARSHDMRPHPVQAIKAVNMALLQGHTVRVADADNRLGWADGCPQGYILVPEPDRPQSGSGQPLVQVSWKTPGPEPVLTLHPRCLVAGVGCNTKTPSSEIMDLIQATFAHHHLALASLQCLVTTSKKAEEPGLQQTAADLGLDLVCIPHQILNTMPVPTPSETVRKHMGVPSVCEATALLHTHQDRLLVPKTKSKNATLAVALRP